MENESKVDTSVLQQFGFETDPALTDQKAAHALDVIRELKLGKRGVARRLRDLTAIVLAFGKPANSRLREPLRSVVQAYGFRPLARTLSGTIPFHHIPFWVDPAGVATLSIYGTHRWYLHTYFEDGSAICTAVKETGNANTESIVTHDFATGYPRHLEAVRRKLDRDDIRVVHRITPEVLRKSWSVYHLYQMAPGAAAMVIFMDLMLIALAAFFVWTLGEVVYSIVAV